MKKLFLILVSIFSLNVFATKAVTPLNPHINPQIGVPHFYHPGQPYPNAPYYNDITTPPRPLPIYWRNLGRYFEYIARPEWINNTAYGASVSIMNTFNRPILCSGYLKSLTNLNQPVFFEQFGVYILPGQYYTFNTFPYAPNYFVASYYRIFCSFR